MLKSADSLHLQSFCDCLNCISSKVTMTDGGHKGLAHLPNSGSFWEAISNTPDPRLLLACTAAQFHSPFVQSYFLPLPSIAVDPKGSL